MKRLLLFSLISLVALACTQEKKVKDTQTKVVSEPYKHLYGFWVGDFKSVNPKDSINSVNRINIAIKSIIGDKVIGQSIVAGNKRKLVGKIDTSNNQLRFVLTEPGDNKYDGKFEFEIKDNVLTGIWTAYDESLNVSERSYELTKKDFVYDASLMLPELDYADEFSSKDSTVLDTIDGEPEEYMERYFRVASDNVYKINSSTHKFTEEELKNFKKLDLEILRNTIFARHGYTFKKRAYRQFFDQVDWYVPVTDNVDGQLTDLEKANAKLFSRFEKYAEDNYDTFSR